MIDRKIVFVHIPKTAGSSFAYYLRFVSCNIKRDIEKFWYDEFTDPKKYEDFDIIYGHFPVKKYMYLDPIFITFVRDPAERVVSQYYYNKKKECPNGESLIEYAEKPEYQNLMSKQIESLSYFDFVGIQENFDESLDRFGEMFGVEFPEERTVKKRSNHYYKIKTTMEERRLIRKLNWLDTALYREAVRIWESENEDNERFD
jgi:hypothetical protein